MQRILVSEHQKTEIFCQKNKLRNGENNEKINFSEEDFEQLHSYQPRTFFNKAII